MAHELLEQAVTDVADAIRHMEGSADLIPTAKFPERIRGLTLTSGGKYAWYVFTADGTKYIASDSPDTYPNAGAIGEAFYLKVGVTLEEMKWSEVAELCDAGYADQLIYAGDEKTVTLTNGEVVTMVAADLNHDDLTSGGKAPVTFIAKHCLKATRAMNSSDTNSGGWNGCAMRTYCNGALFDLMPDGLKENIKTVNKKTSAGKQSTAIQTAEDKIWLPSGIEVFGTANASYYPPGEGTLYPIFTDNASRVKNLNNSPCWWWLRSPCVGGSTHFCYVGTDGTLGDSSASGSGGVAFGFCI